MELMTERTSKHMELRIDRVCGVLTPTSGEITYNGVPVSEERYRSVLGYLPQEFGCYPEFSGRDFLRNCAGFAEQTAGVDPG